MPEMLLLNPAKPRKAKRKAPRSAAQKRATAKLVAMNKSRSRAQKRRSNPVAAKRRSVKKRVYRANPVSRVTRRIKRRRNPISMGGGIFKQMFGMVKDAAVMGAGAVAFDAAHAQIAKVLPAQLRVVPGSVGVGDVFKAATTALIGSVLNRMTRGYAGKAAVGALTVQAHGLIANAVSGMVPLAGLGYSVPARVSNMVSRTSPNVPNQGALGRYTRAPSPLLSRYTAPGVSPLLNGSRVSAMQREGFGNIR